MPRPVRVFFEGALYHVYNRVARGEPLLGDPDTARGFVELLREVVDRDQVTVLAWCVMSNHFHLALRTSVITLDRPMRSLQQRFSSRYNLKHNTYGPLWQGRYRAKLVTDERYFRQLLAYIHLNPVSAGVVDDPAEYQWSGHREIVRRVEQPLVDVDEVLSLFGETRRAARAGYARALRDAAGQGWLDGDPGSLPWWPLGRPPASEKEDPGAAADERRKLTSAAEGRDRLPLAPGEFVERCASLLGVSVGELRGRGRATQTVRAREIIATLGVRRFGLRARDLARELGKHSVTASVLVMRGSQKWSTDAGFQEQLEGLDKALAAPGGS